MLFEVYWITNLIMIITSSVGNGCYMCIDTWPPNGGGSCSFTHSACGFGCCCGRSLAQLALARQESGQPWLFGQCSLTQSQISSHALVPCHVDEQALAVGLEDPAQPRLLNPKLRQLQLLASVCLLPYISASGLQKSVHAIFSRFPGTSRTGNWYCIGLIFKCCILSSLLSKFSLPKKGTNGKFYGWAASSRETRPSIALPKQVPACLFSIWL